jgi:DedD protein
MAFFKFRLPGQSTSEPQGNFSNTPAESVDVMRRRARHRLIGASVLVIVGVVGFPLLFDTQPRPVSVDIAVDIPDRTKSKPLASASSATKQAPLSTGAGLDPKEEVVAKSEPKSEPKAESALAAVAPVAKPEPVKPEPAKAEAVKTEASKTDKPTQAQPADTKPAASASDTKADAPRFVVQVGAFSDEGKAREVRGKLEKAGYKTYTHVAETKEGKRTRVRVGPFTSRDEADKAAQKIKQLQLQPQVLTL